MTRLIHFTPRTRACRFAAQVVASAASYVPACVLKRLVRPLVRCSRGGGPVRLRGPINKALALIVGDGVSQRVMRPHRREQARR